MWDDVPSLFFDIGAVAGSHRLRDSLALARRHVPTPLTARHRTITAKSRRNDIPRAHREFPRIVASARRNEMPR
jgi:hypothetical protein